VIQIRIAEPQPEVVGRAALRLLRTYLPAYLTAVAVAWQDFDIEEWGAPIELEPPRDDAYYYGSQDMSGEWPAIILEPMSEELRDKVSHGRQTSHPESTEWVLDIYVDDDRSSRVTPRLQRYATAVKTLLRDLSTLNDAEIDAATPVSSLWQVKAGLVSSVAYYAVDLGSHLCGVARLKLAYLTLTDT
jgi:hypothetical protein